MTDEAGDRAFKRTLAIAGMSTLWALALGVGVRMKTVTMDQRAALVDEVQSRSGRRLARLAARPSRHR